MNSNIDPEVAKFFRRKKFADLRPSAAVAAEAVKKLKLEAGIAEKPATAKVLQFKAPKPRPQPMILTERQAYYAGVRKRR